LAAVSTVVAGGIAGCAGQSNGGDGDGGSDGDGSGVSDPFASVKMGPTSLTATLKDGTQADTVTVLNSEGNPISVGDTDGDGAFENTGVPVEGGTAEVPVTYIGECGTCDKYNVVLPDGEYNLVAKRSGGDGTPTTVGRRTISVNRQAEITGIEIDSEGTIYLTIANVGDILINLVGRRQELVDSGTTRFPVEELEFESQGYLSRRDSPSHNYSKPRRPTITNIVAPGEEGTFAVGIARMYGNKDGACTGQSVEMKLTVTGRSLNGTTNRASTTLTVSFSGGPNNSGGPPWVCKEYSVE
jgi:hypothetical protein